MKNFIHRIFGLILVVIKIVSAKLKIISLILVMATAINAQSYEQDWKEINNKLESGDSVPVVSHFLVCN